MKEFMIVLLGIISLVFAITFYISIIVVSLIVYFQIGIFDVVMTLGFLIPISFASARLARLVYKLANK